MIQFSIKNNVHFILFVVLLMICSAVFPQSKSRSEKQYEKALEYYNLGNLKLAEEVAKKVVENDPVFFNAYLLLAEIAHESGSARYEIEYLEKAQPLTENPIIYVRLAEAHYSLGDYAEALNYFEKYLPSKNISKVRRAQIEQKTASCKFAIEAQKHPVEFKPERLSTNINSANDEYWPVLSIDQKELVFTRLIPATGRLPQEDFYVSRFDSGNWSVAKPISEINTRWNEGAETLSADGKLLFFTACNRTDGKGSCDIYYSKNENGRWSRPRNVGGPVSTSSWEGQPSFSSDNRYLYFSSNRAGGMGQKDIWRAEFLGFNNQIGLHWGKVENLGDSINTQGNEISPFIHANNKDLFFASDYHTGMGGMDLFRSEVKSENRFSKPVNLGFPINTIGDEQGLNISGDGTEAFFASARNKNTGLDIYRFEVDKNLQPDPVTYVKAKVIDAKTKQPVQAEVELADLTNSHSEIRKEKADGNGEILLCLPLGVNYSFTVSENGYLFYSQAFQLTDSKTLYQPFLLTIELQPVEVGAEMNLYNIYFETDSFTILPASEPELQKLVSFLIHNPKLKVEIQGHTDNTGNADKNQVLSEKRAKSVVNFLVEKGLDKNRLHDNGFGDRLPVASNETEEGRRQNRRTTVKIIGN
ncbi:MAG TPA: OmpA family protein [Draconibacterium sp.]|nr:OmpA family protein [Draconibacterium sp.]